MRQTSFSRSAIHNHTTIQLYAPKCLITSDDSQAAELRATKAYNRHTIVALRYHVRVRGGSTYNTTRSPPKQMIEEINTTHTGRKALRVVLGVPCPHDDRLQVDGTPHVRRGGHIHQAQHASTVIQEGANGLHLHGLLRFQLVTSATCSRTPR